MRIGIDVSQIAYEGTGVAEFVEKLVKGLLEIDKKNEYILFFSSLRNKIQSSKFKVQNDNAKVKIKSFRLPPILLDLLWNRFHILPIETLIGDVDVFLSSDWVQPPSKKAKKVSILYDLIIYKYPEETHGRFKFNFKNFLISPNIVASQKRRLGWVKKECDKVLCISEATKRDAMEILGIEEERLKVIYPGI